jgi:2-dehydro-3-deoxygluconokinase
VSARVVTLGEAMLRLTAPRGTRLAASPAYEVHVAGAEANVAAALARLGVAVTWISALPATPPGDRVAEELAAAGVDLSHVTRLPGARLGLFFAELAAAPRATRVWYDRADSAFTKLESFDAGVLEGAAYAVVSGITPALGPRSRELAERFAAEAHAHGASLCIDVNYRALLWPPEEAAAVLAPLLAQAGVVVCAARDAELLFGLEADDAEPARRLAEQIATNADLVAVTLGDRGSEVYAAGETRRRAVEPADVVDPFGTGDAFTAGLLWGLLEGLDPGNVLAAATALAGLKCTIAGDLSRFDRAELLAALGSIAGTDRRPILR